MVCFCFLSFSVLRVLPVAIGRDCVLLTSRPALAVAASHRHVLVVNWLNVRNCALRDSWCWCINMWLCKTIIHLQIKQILNFCLRFPQKKNNNIALVRLYPCVRLPACTRTGMYWYVYSAR